MKAWIRLALLVLAWHLIAFVELFPAFVLPSPISVISTFEPAIVMGAFATLARAVIGFSVGVAAAYLAILVAHCTGSVRSADAQFSAARAIPALAAMPLFLLWFGLGEVARVLVILLSVLAFVAGPLAESVLKLPREWTIHCERLGKGRYWEFWHIVVPGTLGPMIGALRVGLAIALTTSVATDFMGASSGLGRSVDVARVTFNVPALFLLLLIAAAMGLALDKLLSALLRGVGHWLGRTAKG